MNKKQNHNYILFLLYITLKSQEEFKKLLPSVINYDNLDSYSGLGLDYNCNDLKQKKAEKEDIKNFYKICMSITGVIDSFNEISIYNSIDNNKCTVFALWMYDYLIKELKNGNDYSKIEKFINIISPIFKIYSRRIGCEIPSYIGIEKYVDSLKTLYDFAINYDTIMLHIQNNDNKCSENFSEYINEKVRLLSGEMGICAYSTKPHCKVFNDIFKQPIIEKLLNLGCTKVSSQQIKEILDAKLEGQSSEEEGVENSVILPLASISPKETSHVRETEVQIATNEIPSTNNNVMRTTLPVVGSAFTMSLLYRFTPVGSWISNRLRGNGRRSHNLNNISYGPQGDLPDQHTLDSLRNQFNISYRPV